MNPACRVRSRRRKWYVSDLRIIPRVSGARTWVTFEGANNTLSLTGTLMNWPLTLTFACLLAAVGGWGLWQHGGRQGRLEELFAYLMGIAMGFAMAYAAFHLSS